MSHTYIHGFLSSLLEKETTKIDNKYIFFTYNVSYGSRSIHQGSDGSVSFFFLPLGVLLRARYRLAGSRDLRSRLAGRWWHGAGPTVKHRKLHSRAIKSMGSCYSHSIKEREAQKREMDQRAVHHERARIICFLQLPGERGRVC